VPLKHRGVTKLGAGPLLAALLSTLVPVTAWPENPGPAGGAEADATRTTPTFEQLLAESGMMLEMPKGLEPAEIRPNRLFRYDKALVSRDSALEIRYAVRPLGRIVIDYQDPHSATPDPNHMFPVMFQSLVTLLSGGGHSPTREYPAQQARERFNADWAAAAVFDVSPELEADQKQALLLALHRNGLADAYAVFLFDDHEKAKPRIDSYLRALRFMP